MRLPALLLGALLATGGLTSGCASAGAGGCRPASAAAALAGVAPKPPPKPKKTADRKPVCTPSTSDVWKSFKPYRGSIKTNGESRSKRRFYQWDHTHGDIEVYGNDKFHLGSMDASTGKMTKPPVPGRKIDLP